MKCSRDSLSVTARLTERNVHFASRFLQAENVLSDALVFEKDGEVRKLGLFADT